MPAYLVKSGILMMRYKTDLLCVGCLLLIAYLLFFLGIGSYYLWDPWEPKYAKAMQEMLSRQDYITPYLKDKIRWTKPILIYWSMLAPVWFAGVTEWSVRLPSAVAATFGLIVIYYLLLQLRGRQSAIIGACVLATIPQYFYIARQAMPDMLMTSLLTAAMAAFAIGRFKPGRTRFFYAFYAFLALAFLAKGPVTGAITLIALLLFLLVDLNWRAFNTLHSSATEIKRLWRYYRVTGGLLIFIAIAAPWYVMMLIKHGQDYIDHFLLYENITRFKEPIRSHRGLVTYYIQNLFHGMYPWSGFLPAAFLFLFYGQNQCNEEVKQRWYFVSWFFAVFLLFSFAGTKQQHYILPITPYVAILAALVLQEYLKAKPAFWIKPALLLSALIVWLTLRDFFIAGDKYLFDVFTVRMRLGLGDSVDDFLLLFLCAWILLMLVASVWRKGKPIIIGGMVLAAFSNGFYFTQIVMPAHTEKRTLKPYIDLYREQSSENSRLVFFSSRKQSSIYYYFDRNKYQRFTAGQSGKLVKFVRKNPYTFIIAEKRYTKKLLKKLHKYSRVRWRRFAHSHAMYILLKPIKNE